MYEGLFGMMLRNLFLSICNRNLLLFLKECIPKDKQEMPALADQSKVAMHAKIQTNQTNAVMTRQQTRKKSKKSKHVCTSSC